MTDPHWTQVVAALLTPVVAVFGLYFAWRQARTAQRKLKFDLFTKRLAVYESARSLLTEVMINGNVSPEAMQSFAVGTSETRWLFDATVFSYVREELWPKALDLQCVNMELQDLAVGEERDAKVKRRKSIKEWFRSQSEVLDAKVSPFLQLEH